MAKPNPDFSLDSKKRIAKTVRRVEAWPADYGNIARPGAARTAGETIWGLLGTRDGTDRFKYPWRERWAMADGTWAEPDSPRSGTLVEEPAYNPDKLDIVDLSGTIALLRRTQYLREADQAWLPVWGIVSPPRRTTYRVKITSSKTGRAKYGAKSIDTSTIAADINTTTDADATTLGTLASTEDCLVINEAEFTNTDWATLPKGLNVGTVLDGQLLYTNSDGKKVVTVSYLDLSDCDGGS